MPTIPAPVILHDDDICTITRTYSAAGYTDTTTFKVQLPISDPFAILTALLAANGTITVTEAATISGYTPKALTDEVQAWAVAAI